MIARDHAVLVALLMASLPAQDDRPRPAPLFVEIDGLVPEAYLQQELALVVRIGVDRAWFGDHAVALFQQRLDQPFHVVVPWLQAAEDRAVEVVAPAPGARTQRLAVGDRVLPLVVEGERQVDGRSFQLLALRCRWLPLAAGRSTIAPVQVRYAFAERFEQDFLRGRTPLERRETTVASPAVELTVRPLPQPAPAGFGGAVGSFVVRLLPPTTAAVLGDSLTVALEITGTGNLDRFAPLSPPALDGFHVQGVVDQREPGRRRFTLDLLPLRSGAQTLPPVPFVMFEPQRGRYWTTYSQPHALLIAPASAALPARVQELVQADAARMAAHAAWSGPVWAGLLVGVLLAALLWRAAARRQLQRLRRQAAEAAVLASFAAEPAAALAAFDVALAARLSVAQWPGPTGFAALVAGGVPAATVRALQEVRQLLDGARFGGIPPSRDQVESALRG